jgi:hypothetical protein
MGEKRAIGESILGNFADYVELKGIPSSIAKTFGCLCTFNADIFKYVHSAAFGYNKCRFSSTLKAALMVKSSSGEINA